ncbi:MAG: hypothetical protein ACD_22C00072G0018 [uncultured bacterium]|nr:MAG: hypothetical protein ACD_22C00072G0018 [uncultured bacterium]
MPAFLYTVALVNIALWGLWARSLFISKPDSLVNILVFLLLFFFALALTIAFPVYFYYFKKAPTLTKLRLIYRKSLKWGLFLSAGVTLLMALRAFQLFNIVTVVLFVILYVALFTQLKGRR